MISKLRDSLLGAIGRSTRARRVVVGAMAAVAGQRGAVPEIVDEARSGAAERPLNRSAQMLLWAQQVPNGRPLPRHFDPSEHLLSASAQEAAARALEQRLRANARPVRPDLGGQLIRLRADRSLSEIAREVEADLASLLHAKATTASPSKGGIAPDMQLSIVTDLTRLLEAAGVQPFLMSGTLLGVVRDGGFMAHDYDIDLGLLPTADVDLVEATLAGCKRYVVTTEGDRIVAVHDSGVRTDLFPHSLRDGRFWHGTLVHEWWNTPFELVSSEVSGEALWVPADPELYLDENYGDWRHPVAFYDVSFDTPNRTYRQDAFALLHLHRQCVRAIEANNRWLLESSVRELRDNFGVDATEFLNTSRLLSE